MDWTQVALAVIATGGALGTAYIVYLGKKIEAGIAAAKLAHDDATAAIRNDVRELHIEVNGRLTQLLATTGGEQKEIGRAEGKASEQADAANAPHNRRIGDVK